MLFSSLFSIVIELITLWSKEMIMTQRLLQGHHVLINGALPNWFSQEKFPIQEQKLLF